MRLRSLAPLLLVLAALAAGACREGAAGRPRLPRVSAGPFPRTVTQTSGDAFLLDEPPSRVLAANAGVVDFLAVLLPPERVVALPEASDEFSTLDGAGDRWGAVARFRGYHAETVLAHAPDLVIAHGWQAIETTGLLRGHGIRVLELPTPATWAEIRATLALLGQVLGQEGRAAEELARLDARVARLRERGRDGPRLGALSYSNLGAAGWVGGEGTTSDILFELAGLRSVATEHGIVGHRQVDVERLFALDPDVVVVGTLRYRDGASPTAAFLRDDPYASTLRAVREGHVVSLPPRLFTTSSLEVLRAAEVLRDEVDALAR